MGTPDVPTVPERQASKLPDQGAKTNDKANTNAMRRAMLAGMVTSPGGLGAPHVSKATLG